MVAANPVRRGIQLVGLQALARHMGVTYRAVRTWETKCITAERVLAFESATCGQVTRYELRPDRHGEHPERYLIGEMHWASDAGS